MCSKTQFCFLNLRTYFIYLCCYLLIVMAAATRVVNGLKCYCNHKECDPIESLNCPSKGILLLDPCKCCYLCAKTLGETCGGPGDFSGECEPPLKCVTRLPVSKGLGICMDLSFTHSPSTHHIEECTNLETIHIESGCEIVDKRCQCWPKKTICRNHANTIEGITDIRWHFRTMEDCKLNLRNLIKLEMEFDEDYTVSPSIYTFKRIRRKKRSLKRKIKLKNKPSQLKAFH